MTPVSIITVVVGLAVLLFGRRLFWLFVGAAGFLAGLHWATDAFHGQPEWVAVVVALVVAVLGALLAVSLQVLAIGLGGFLAGVYATREAARIFHVADDRSLWLVAVVAGVVAALLLLWLWDWALVVLSALTGATLLAPLPRVASPLGGLLFVGLFLVGLVVQATQLAAQSKVSRASTARRS